MRINRKRLAIQLIQKNLPVGDLVNMSGLSRSTISAVRSGKSCSCETARKIASALGVSVEYLTKNEVMRCLR